MDKKKLLIFSDCFTYSGSEVVIENLLLSEKIKRKFNVKFLYGYNRTYSMRFKERAKFLGLSTNLTKPVYLLSPEWCIYQYRLKNEWSIEKLV